MIFSSCFSCGFKKRSDFISQMDEQSQLESANYFFLNSSSLIHFCSICQQIALIGQNTLCRFKIIFGHIILLQLLIGPTVLDIPSSTAVLPAISETESFGMQISPCSIHILDTTHRKGKFFSIEDPAYRVVKKPYMTDPRMGIIAIARPPPRVSLMAKFIV